jgi:hypothetical protein
MAEKMGQVARIDVHRTPAKAGQVTETPTPAETIAASVGAVVDAVVGAAIPWGDRGADFSAEADIEHRAADGSTTRAKISFKYGARQLGQ